MKAVARLVTAYFTSTPLTRALSVLGILICAGSFATLRAAGDVMSMQGVSALGIALLLAGSGTMPLLFGRFIAGRTAGIVPRARVTLFISALLATCLVALPGAIIAAYGHPPPPAGLDPRMLANIARGSRALFWLTFCSTFTVASWLYLALWFVTSRRDLVGALRGLLVLAVLLFAPTRNIQQLDARIGWLVVQMASFWGVLAIFLAAWPRLARLRWRERFAWRAQPSVQKLPGRELDLMLGTARPWMFALLQVVPIAIATRIGFYSPVVWLYYLTIFSAVAGAMAGQAAERSRPMWLRAGWSRRELFAHVERAFWRHNGYVVGVLALLMVAIGSYAGIPAKLLALGLPLLLLGSILSTYAGLFTTRGLGWREAVLGTATMVALMAVAVIAARSDPPDARSTMLVVALEAALAIAAAVVRAAARRRWARIDWALCRRAPVARARAA